MLLLKRGYMKIFIVLFVILLTLLCIGTLFAESYFWVDSQIAPKWCSFYVFGGFLIFLYELVLYKYGNCTTLFAFCIRVFFFIVVICCSIQAIYGLGQYFGVWISNMPNFVTGSFDNPVGFAFCLTSALPIFLYFLINSKNWVRIIVLLSICTVVFAIVVSGSRTAILALFVYVLFLYFYFRKRFKISFITFAFFIFLIIVISFIMYCSNEDSVNGRFLIWKCSIEMIKDKPLLGWGTGGFQKVYMYYQADYFRYNADDYYSYLADNVKHPFNEFLLIIIEYGLLGLLLVLFFFFILIYCGLQKRRKVNSFIFVLILLSIIVFSCFSYPFMYPFIWILLIVCAFQLLDLELLKNIICKRRIFFVLFIVLFCFYGLWVTGAIAAELKWCHISKRSLLGETESVLPYYQRLGERLSENPFFLYSYAVELNSSMRYSESIKVLKECESFYNDYDVKMLQARNYEKVGDLLQAENYYQLASRMCPNRFLPLYYLVHLYQSQGEEKKAKKIAKKIVEKRVKINSYIIDTIKNEMKKYIE